MVRKKRPNNPELSEVVEGTNLLNGSIESRISPSSSTEEHCPQCCVKPQRAQSVLRWCGAFLKCRQCVVKNIVFPFSRFPIPTLSLAELRSTRTKAVSYFADLQLALPVFRGPLFRHTTLRVTPGMD